MISSERYNAYEHLRSAVTAVLEEYLECKRRGGILGPLTVTNRFEELMSNLKHYNTYLFDIVFREDMEDGVDDTGGN